MFGSYYKKNPLYLHVTGQRKYKEQYYLRWGTMCLNLHSRQRNASDVENKFGIYHEGYDMQTNPTVWVRVRVWSHRHRRLLWELVKCAIILIAVGTFLYKTLPWW